MIRGKGVSLNSVRNTARRFRADYRRILARMLMIALLAGCIVTVNPLQVSAASDDAVFIHTELPDEMLAGNVYPVAMVAQNTGTNNWTVAARYALAAATSNQFLWSQMKNGGFANSLVDARAYMEGSANVSSLWGATFNYSVTAPTTPGNYTLGATMFQDLGAAAFGQQYSKTIAVKNIVVDGLPKKLMANTSYRVTVSVINTSAATWTSTGNYKLTKLDSNFTWSNWSNGGSGDTANLSSSDSVAPGQGISFSFNIMTPATAGTYPFLAQVRVGSTGVGDTYTRSITVSSDSGIYSYEGESFITNKTGNKTTDSASGGSYAYSQGSGNTPMYKSPSAYTSYVAAPGEYNIWMRVNSTQTVPLRIQMYGGPSDGIYADFATTDINTWQWIGPLKVNFSSGYSNYQLTLWKLGGGSNDFVGIDQIYMVSADTENAYARKLQTDQGTMTYVIPQRTPNGINVNANSIIPVFYNVKGGNFDSVVQLVDKTANDNYATLRDSIDAGVMKIKIDYLGPSSGKTQFRFTNLSGSYDGKGSDTILKADGVGRIIFTHGGSEGVCPVLLDSDLMPGQSIVKNFNPDWLNVNGNYVVKVYQRNNPDILLGTFTVAPSNVGASTVITNNTGKTRMEAETRITNKTGTGSDSLASNGSYSYASGTAGNINISTGNQSYTYYVNTPGTYHAYARVRANNHASVIRLQMYGTDGSAPFYDAHPTGSDNGWQWIGPLRVTLDSSKSFNLAIWRLSGQANDSLQVDAVDFIKEDYGSTVPRPCRYMTVGADNSYDRLGSLQNRWKVIEVTQPPKATSLYVKLNDDKQMVANKETLNVTLGSNLAVTPGATINDWTIGGKRVFMTWYYPYRDRDIYANWQSQITSDLQSMASSGYNVVLLQLFPQWFTQNPDDPNQNTMAYTLTECRRLGIKVLPSIYYLNQSQWLTEMTGITFRSMNSHDRTVFADATDPKFSTALSAWFDWLYARYGDVYYTNADGKKPVMYFEEHGYGFPQGYPYCSREAPNNIESFRQFRDWLQTKYGTNTALNAAWGNGSNYPAFGTDDNFPNIMASEISNDVLNRTPGSYPVKWAEGGLPLADFDAYRSYSLKTRWLDTRGRILANHPNILFGGHTFGIYGLEDINGSYYNYTAQRSGVLADDLVQYCDFVETFYNTDKEVESAIDFWHAKNKDLITFIPENFSVAEIGGSSPMTTVDGARVDVPGLNGLMYMNTYPLYPVLKETVKKGGIPAVYAWNDYPLYDSNTADVRDIVSIFKANAIP